MKNKYTSKITLLAMLLMMMIRIPELSAQRNMESVSDDWKGQTSNYVVVGYTSNDPADHIWEHKTNQLQGIHIYVNPSEIAPIYVQLNNNVINFSTRSGEDFAYTYMTQLKVSINDGDYTELYSGSPKQDVVWFESADAFDAMGEHKLEVYIVDEFGHSYQREYNIKMVVPSDELYKDNFGNTLRVWKGNATNFATPVVFSEGFDAYDTNPQEMYYYAAQDLISCMNQHGFDVFLLDNRFGTQNIRNNAAGFSSAVRFISSLYDGMDVIAGGVSMGGMIARYAFAKEEGAGNPLPASVFISVDSPQQGAVVSKPLQDYKKEKQQGDGFAEHALNNDAAKQLLTYAAYDPDGSIHTSFYAELNSLNGDGYPHLTKNIGVSFSTDQPNPGSGEWLKIEWFVPIHDSKTFYLTAEERQAGSYLPIDLTTTDPTVMIASYWWVLLVLPPLQPLYYPTVYFHRFQDPAYIPYTSALDLVNNQSKFDVTIIPQQTTHHDVLPPEIIDPIVSELLLIDTYIQNSVMDDAQEFIGKNIQAGHHVTEKIPYGDVILQNGADVHITASESFRLKEGTQINTGARLTMNIDGHYSTSCSNTNSSSAPKELNQIYMETTMQEHHPKPNYTSLSRSFQSEELNQIEWTAYPNPTQGRFTLRASAPILSIRVFDALGETICIFNEINQTEQRIDMASFPKGVYYVRATTGQEIHWLKIIRQ